MTHEKLLLYTIMEFYKVWANDVSNSDRKQLPKVNKSAFTSFMSIWESENQRLRILSFNFNFWF